METQPLFVLALAAITSAGACLVGVRRFGWPFGDLLGAAGRVLDCAGFALIFLAANLAVGVTTILALRRLTGEFVSLYLAGDLAVVLISLLQAIALQWWRERSRR